jgi:hypothetical protein
MITDPAATVAAATCHERPQDPAESLTRKKMAQDSLWSSGSHAAVTSKESDSFNDQNFAEHKHRKESSVLRLSELSKLLLFFVIGMRKGELART